MTRSSRKMLWIAVIAALPVVGYILMYSINQVAPMTQNDTPYHIFYTVILIALGLAIPTLMLKTLFHAAHINNPQERELHMRDLPKDKDDAEKL